MIDRMKSSQGLIPLPLKKGPANGVGNKNPLRQHLHTIFAIAVFSAVVNLLMLTGPVFMLQVYDRVLASRSEATLLVLFSVVIFLYGLMGILDYVRGRILTRIGASLQSEMDPFVFEATLGQPEDQRQNVSLASGLSDVISVRSFLTSSVPAALFDLPWAPIFLVLLFGFHPFMGWMAIGGGITLMGIALANQWATRNSLAAAQRYRTEADGWIERVRENVETVAGLGMVQPLLEIWNLARSASLLAHVSAADSGGAFTVAIKVFRLFLQSGMLALAAWLVIREELTPGAMIAGTVLLGRALAPIEQVVGQWGLIHRGIYGWRSLSTLMRSHPRRKSPMSLPRPEARLAANSLVVLAPGVKQALLQGITFEVGPGEAMAVIGPSASGKSTLARALAGLLPIAQGEVRLGGATLDQYERHTLGRSLGYLPQNIMLFPGRVSTNIARLDADPPYDAVLSAAKAAGVHELILAMPEGYNTVLGEAGNGLSGGQRQRIGLARALYGNPPVLILDEPDSNLDDAGSRSLRGVIATAKLSGRAVVVISHRPSALAECEKVLILEGGRMIAFAPRAEVLQKFVRGRTSVVNGGKESA